MARGPKKKSGKQTRITYRQFRAIRNKDRNKARSEKVKTYYDIRNKIMEEFNLNKTEARKKIRELQGQGKLTKDILRR